MPRRNALKTDMADSFYHVYARGNSGIEIFVEPQDYAAFLNLLKRYLSHEAAKDPYGVQYPHLRGAIELTSFCLMPTHFHLLVYQVEQGAMTQLMSGVMTSYSRYFNKKYRRSGSLFESRYKASMILLDAYLHHITRYIHLNPKHWQTYKYSSLPFYLGKQQAEWLQPGRILDLFSSAPNYLEFLKDYQGQKQMLDKIKHELANSTTG